MGTRLLDQVAIVTGAGNGIGRSIATGLAEESAHICVVDIDPIGARQTAQQVERLKRRAMAVEVDVSRPEAPKKIRVNCIAPGVTLTPLTAHYATAKDADSLAMVNLMNTVPAGRWGRPEDIAAAALFLASDEADYVIGVVLPVDGGWSAR
jgi:NAD(P)-dependent dehydrogenase (short-subunit alcohol dehydrogenase family)